MEATHKNLEMLKQITKDRLIIVNQSAFEDDPVDALLDFLATVFPKKHVGTTGKTLFDILTDSGYYGD